MAPIIDIIRHAEAEHNIKGSQVRDPGLTARGRRQARRLAAAYPYRDRVARIVASPMRRTIETALAAFAPADDGDGEGAAGAQSRITLALLPELQEVNASPSSTGSPVRTLMRTYGDAVDVTRLGADEDEDEDEENGWFRKGSDTPFAPDPAKVAERARRARGWLRDLARTLAAAPDNSDTNAASTDDDDATGDGKDRALHIVVVTHGEFAHWLTGDFSGVSALSNTGWRNAEFRSYQFAAADGDEDEDENAIITLVETERSIVRRGALAGLSPPPLPPDGAENARRRDVAAARVQMYALAAAEDEWEDVEEEAGG